MSEEKKGCASCGASPVVNPRTGLCATCEPIFQERNKAGLREEIQKYLPFEKKNISSKNPGTNPSISAIGDDLLGLAEHFGVERKEIGKALLKGATTGKFDIFKDTTSGKRTKFEKAVFALKELAWIPLAYIVTYQLLTLLVLKLT